MGTGTSPFSLLNEVFGDPEMADVFSAESTVSAWLRVEAALAGAQADLGLIPSADAQAIVRAATLDSIDLAELWKQTHVVGYPILPLVRMIAAALPPGPDGHVHLGATTQDIMDTGLALQLQAANARLARLLGQLGDELVRLVAAHGADVMAARTHAQQAVPTTFGAKLAGYLAELSRHRERLAQSARRTQLVSLYGAGGTGAAFGGSVTQIRSRLAAGLGLQDEGVSWHAARDGVAEFVLLGAQLASTCGRLAREVVNLARTEIGEVQERGGYHRGASSTMPQKVNPIAAEAVVGFAVSAAAGASAAYRFMQPSHERSAGEWQAEWHCLPWTLVAAAGALATSVDMMSGLRVFPEQMRANLDVDGGLVMAEAYMIGLASAMGRERAHDTVYDAVSQARLTDTPLSEVLTRQLADSNRSALAAVSADPRSYLGDADQQCAVAVERWVAGRA